MGVIRKPVIAIAQIKYYDINKTHNLIKIKRYIFKAKKNKADIVCFPESCLKKTGSINIEDRMVKSIQAECKKNEIWCIITDDFEINNKVYNSALVIDRNGKIRGNYNKINLYGENTVEAGNKIKIFRTDFGKIGIAICWDLTFPELFSEMKRKGAEIIFCPAQWNYDVPAHKSRPIYREIELLRSMVLARAHENVIYVAICNPLMDSKTQVSYSAIADPHRIIKEKIGEEGLITAELDIIKLRKFRRLYSKE
ncbi:carbon-nitrogen hydrolase family protein [Candidatus Woesearchaeota archaeon]|nr:carbon-nitrogen hydrolase family protein [Candidatus Woesearchaeota archaeon]